MQTILEVGTRAANLIAALADHLKQEGRLEQPFIMQDRVTQTRTLHVVVVWDRWSSMTRELRSKVILDAFEKANLLKGYTITVAMGLTQKEADEMGYLPYSIGTMHRSGDRYTLDQLRRVLKSLGGVQVKDGQSLQVRFPTIELAEKACRLAHEKAPGPYWTIIEKREIAG